MKPKRYSYSRSVDPKTFKMGLGLKIRGVFK